jgi:hypothetical protein
LVAGSFINFNKPQPLAAAHHKNRSVLNSADLRAKCNPSLGKARSAGRNDAAE